MNYFSILHGVRTVSMGVRVNPIAYSFDVVTVCISGAANFI
jgi:hypothetical protein